jgi:dTDP-4-amino-4,6-dideoxygalactose transaminase
LTAPAIPLFDLRMEEEDLAAVAAVLRSGRLRAGEQVEAFEREFAAHLGVKHAIAVSSGTAALHLAYAAVGIGPGDEVIVPSITFAASAAAVIYCGGTPVFADVCGPHDIGVDPDDVAARITPRTKAICAVHYGGYPAAVERLRELGPALIEDAAHAPDAERGGRKAGAWGDAACFSFFSNKVLAVGEGGLLATDDDAVAETVRSLRSHGMTSGTWDRHRGHAETYDVVALGFNYRMDEPRAALLLSRMKRLDEDIAKRRGLVRGYRERLAGVDGLTLPYADEEVERSSCYVMPVLLADGADRRAFRHALTERGVQTSILYPAIHEFTEYRRRFPDVSLPRTEEVARCEVTLPLFPHMTESQLERVCDAVAGAIRPGSAAT